MRVAFEALSWGRHIHDYRDAWEAVRRADHPVVGLSARQLSYPGTRTGPRRDSRDPSRPHLSRADSGRTAAPNGLPVVGRHYRNFPGRRLADQRFHEGAAFDGYDGLLSLEIFTINSAPGSARSVAVDGQGVDLHTRSTAAGGPARPEAAAAAFRALACLGTSFIGIRDLTRESAIDLEALLAAWASARPASTFSKSVSRWNQGDINIVVNTEKKASTHSTYRSRYVSVCDRAPKSKMLRTLDRAQNLLEQPFRQAVGPGELDITGRGGVGESLVYFNRSDDELARVWDVDFAQLVVRAFVPAPASQHRSHLAIHALQEMLPGCSFTNPFSMLTSAGTGHPRSGAAW